jgi:hypothetical protein
VKSRWKGIRAFLSLHTRISAHFPVLLASNSPPRQTKDQQTTSESSSSPGGSEKRENSRRVSHSSHFSSYEKLTHYLEAEPRGHKNSEEGTAGHVACVLFSSEDSGSGSGSDSRSPAHTNIHSSSSPSIFPTTSTGRSGLKVNFLNNHYFILVFWARVRNIFNFF